MPKERKKVLCMDAQRHAEYYGMQRTFDELYAKSKAGETFTGLMELVLSPDNIMLAYRNIKTNTGSYTAGTDKQNIGDIGRLPPAEVIGKVRKIVTGSEHGYRPKPVRRKDIPKPNGKTRPLGIPCIWDRLVQQCIKQILEPICEAKFSNNSYGFRPNRSVEHAISRTYSLLQRAHLHYVLEFDIKGFFDNVNHSKLIKQLWTLGIQDKQLLFVIRRILKAPIRIPNLEKLVATIRSREISACLVLQAQSQLKAIYKDNADTIVGNMDSRIFLGGAEPTTLKELNAALGKETIDTYNTSDTRGNSPSYGTNYSKLGKDLATVDELAVLDGGKCILQLRGVRPFLSEKYDLTKHPNYRLTAGYDKKNTFDIEAFLSHRLKLKPNDEYTVIDADNC